MPLRHSIICLAPEKNAVRSILSEISDKADYQLSFMESPEDDIPLRLDASSNTLVIDWMVGSQNSLTSFFQKNKQLFLRSHMNILVVAPDVSAALIAMSTEHGFVKIL